MKTTAFHRLRSAFTLIELLVVLSIIAIVATFAVPAVSGMVRGSAMTQASQEVSNQFSAARQYAITKNRSVEVRLLQFNDPESPGGTNADPTKGHFRALQLMEVLESGGVVPLDKVRMLPQSIMMNPDVLSSLLDEKNHPSQAAKSPKSDFDPALPRGVNYNYRYVSFRFLPNGGTNLSPIPTDTWYLTLHAVTDKVTNATPPANFFTLQIDPVSGSTRIFRPNLS